MKKKILSLILLLSLMLGALPSAAAGFIFTDVPVDSWANDYIKRAVDLGVMNGYGGGLFGYGDDVKRAEFAAMLVRLFGWTPVSPEKPSFADNTDKKAWYYNAIETALANGAVTLSSPSFRPADPITREEMAVMLVRALGYDRLAGSLIGIKSPFSDVSSNAAHIAMAYNFGIINGTAPTAFSPAAFATREQAAAMMLRLYDRYYAKLVWSHAFYAIKAYPQKDLIPGFDAVSFGWSRLDFTDGLPLLNTSSEDGNSHAVPEGFSEIVELAKNSGIPGNLNVYMSAARKVTLPDGTTSDACSAVLTDAAARTEAVKQIIAELTRADSYSGVTIDFEEMRGEALKSGLNLFLEELNDELRKLGLSLYVCVHPVTSDGVYYDAYDYKTIGEYADKVILMAHDYAATALTASDMNAGFTTTPVSPISEIYTAFQAVTDAETGISDKSKLALAISFGTTQWRKTDGKVISATAYSPEPAAVYNRLIDPAAALNYSLTYQNPYLTYRSETGNIDNIIWYEDIRSVEAKVSLAKMFGVTGLSLWRLGMIPAFTDPPDRQVYYDIPAWLNAQK